MSIYMEKKLLIFKLSIYLYMNSPVVLTGGIKTQRPNRPHKRTINTEALEIVSSLTEDFLFYDNI